MDYRHQSEGGPHGYGASVTPQKGANFRNENLCKIAARLQILISTSFTKQHMKN